MKLSLPDAAPWPPPELAGLNDHPFDLHAHFAPIPEDQNAAPLYLEALAEFSPDMAICFPESERDEARRRAVRRHERFASIFDSAQGRAVPGMSTEIIDDVLEEYAIGFEKLALAQERPTCAFELGHTMYVLVPHLEAARLIAAVVRVRNDRDLLEGRFDRPIRSLAMILRLAADLKPRGSLICQLGSLAVERIAGEMVIDILRRPDVRTEHIDRVIGALLDHEKAVLPAPLAKGHRIEYVYERVGLVRWERHNGLRSRKLFDWGDEQLSFGDIVVRGTELNFVNVEAARFPLTKSAVEFNAALDAMTVADLHREAEHVVRHYRERLANAVRPYREQVANEPEPTGFSLTLPGPRIRYAEVFARPVAAIRMAICLAATRRWFRETGQHAPDLEQAVQSAGMSDVPVDPFGDGPIRMARIAGEPVTYSVGPDGTNDGTLPGPHMLQLSPLLQDHVPIVSAKVRPKQSIQVSVPRPRPTYGVELVMWIALAVGISLIALAANIRNPWLGFGGVFVAFGATILLDRRGRLGLLFVPKRRTGFACPACHRPPPVGRFWKCNNCGTPTDIFEPLQLCPKCSAFFLSIMCPHCGQTRAGAEWDESLGPSQSSLPPTIPLIIATMPTINRIGG